MIAVKRAPAREELLDWLSQPLVYAEHLVKADGAPLRLDPWQARYLRDDGKFIALLKSRRVGGSWAMTLKMFIRAQLSPAYTGTFISLNLEEATGKIDYAARMYESLPARFRKRRVIRTRTEIAFEDSRGRRSTLKSIASRAPRGKGGDVGISELPHCRDPQAIYEGALHVTSRSRAHQLTVESTPAGEGGVFYDISRGKYPQFRRYEIPWWQCSALCADPARAIEEAPKLSTRERVERFGTPSMRAIFASMPEDAFRQESELAFIQAEESAFPLSLLHPNCAEDFGAEGNLKFIMRRQRPAPDDWHWLAKNTAGTLVAGFDVGRKKDDSVLFILDCSGQKRTARMAVRLADTGFTEQEEVVALALRNGVKTLCIDSTGMGLPLAERLQQTFGSAVVPVHFTAPVKTRLVSTARVLLMERGLTLPLDRDVTGQLRSIVRRVSDSGDVLFHSEYSGDHHADVAWALLLACHAAESAAPQAVHYEQVLPKKHSWRF